MARLALVLAVTLAVRLFVLPVNEYLHGDAVPRVEFAEAWAASPHLIRSYGDGAAQYGPLHIYLVGTALRWFDRNDAARVVNLAFGVLTVIPIFLVGRRYFGEQAGTWAGLAFAAWGMHIQASTAGGSEAVSLFFMWVTFAALAALGDRPRLGALLVAGVAMNLAAATRYDAWMYVPLLALVPLLLWPDRRRTLVWSIGFVAVCLPFPVFWSVGNYQAHGDAFYVFADIDGFHRRWAEVELARWGEWWLRLHGLGFWPAIALLTLTPGVAALGMLGMYDAWRSAPRTRWLVMAAVVPTAYFTIRSVVFVDFVPLARFTVVQVSLLLPFVWFGAAFVRRHLSAGVARRVIGGTVAVAVIVPAALGLFTYALDNRVAQILTSISPIARNDRAVMAAAAFVAARASDARVSVALDDDATYQDIQLDFYARLPPERVTRLRWPGALADLATRPPDVLVTFPKGMLMQRTPTFAEAPVIGGMAYDERPGLGPSVRVFLKREAR